MGRIPYDTLILECLIPDYISVGQWSPPLTRHIDSRDNLSSVVNDWLSNGVSKLGKPNSSTRESRNTTKDDQI